MPKRAVCLAVVAVAVAVALAATTARAAHSASAPHSGKKALELLHADVTKIAHDYSHKRYGAVCSDLTRHELAHLGGAQACILKIAVINAFAPITKFTITATRFTRDHTRVSVSLYVNGNRKNRVHALAKWEAGAYRLDHQSGWHPKLQRYLAW